MDTNVFSFDPVIKQLKVVMDEEENRHILQTDLKPMEYLLRHIASKFQELEEADREALKIWLQLLHNSLTDANNNILYSSGPRQRCIGCVMCNPGKLSKQIEGWKVLFNYLFQGIQREFSLFARAQQIVIAPVIAPVIPLMDNLQEEENRHILRNGLIRPMNNLLLDMSAVFTDQRRAGPETLNIWLQLLQNSLTQAKDILQRSESGQRQRWLDCLVFNPVRLSKEIKEWSLFFNYLFQGLQKDFSIFVSAEEIVKLSPFNALLEDATASRIKSAQTQVETWLTEADHVTIIGVYASVAGIGKTSLLRKLRNMHEVSHVFHDVIWVRIYADYKTPDLQRLIAKQINLDLPSNSDIDAQKMLLSANLEKKKFLLIVDDLWSPLDLQELGVAFGEGKQSKLLFSTRNRALFPLMKADESIEMPPLSTDEAWKLFRGIAFEDSPVSMEIEESARKIADDCKGSPLSLSVVAAAMNGKTTSVVYWDQISLNLMKSTADPSFPNTHPRVDPELYQRLRRWSYDTLPNPNVKNCFLYCALLPKGSGVSVDYLVHRWIAEGLVRSKQENHLIDVATGHSYANLLVDRCLFQNIGNKKAKNVWTPQSIRVRDAIRDVAIYIGEEIENCVFKASQHLQNFPENLHNEDCKRISLYDNDIENLPTEFTCPKLVSLILSRNRIKDVPSRFLVSLTSLKVLDLSQNKTISSIPPSVGQLKQLEFLDLQYLSEIQDLPAEIGHLSSLKFLLLAGCSGLKSLPSEIGKLQNLITLSIWECESLRAIPYEIFQLTSLDKLDAAKVKFILEIESEVSIWRLKGLRNLTQLRIAVKVDAQEGIKVGIMGTWLEMRHLWLDLQHSGDYVMDDLPRDMQKMSKLQSFILEHYQGLSLPDYTIQFQHLEYLNLSDCGHLRELSPLEWVPNLKVLKLYNCPNLKELGIGNPDRASGFLMLEKLVLERLTKLESLAGPLNNGVWSETTLRRFGILKIYDCPFLKRLPMGMNKLLNLSKILGKKQWWQTIIWEDDSMKVHLNKLFTEWKPRWSNPVMKTKIKESSTV